MMQSNMKKPYALAMLGLTLLTMTGCAGKLICEWESHEEQTFRVIEDILDAKEIRDAKKEDES